MTSDVSPLQLLTTANVVGVLLASALFSLVLTRLRAPRYPADLPWVGVGKSWFSAFSELPQWIQKGYEEHTKRGGTFVIPGLLGTPPEVAIPRSQMAWMLDQPDDVISTAASHYDSLNGAYSFVKPVILGDPYHEHVVHRTLARHLTSLVPAIDEQARICVDDIYGLDEAEWRTVKIWDTLMQFVPRVTHRILVGQPLCENDEYLKGMVGFSESVTRDLVLYPMIPTIIKPLICPISESSPCRSLPACLLAHSLVVASPPNNLQPVSLVRFRGLTSRDSCNARQCATLEHLS